MFNIITNNGIKRFGISSDILLEKRSNIKDIVFTKPLNRSFGVMGSNNNISKWDRVDHEDLAAVLAKGKYPCASVIIVSDRLDESLWDDPKYMHKTHEIGVSEIRQKAREMFRGTQFHSADLNGQTPQTDRYYTIEEIQELFKKYEFPEQKYNFPIDKEIVRKVELVDEKGNPTGIHGFIKESNEEYSENARFKYEIEDDIFASCELRMIPKLLDEYKEECQYDYDEKDELRKLTRKEFKVAWEKRLEEIFMPRIYTNYDRIYHMPPPFSWWDDRNIFQQWYFVDVGKEIQFISGGSGSSQQREYQGRFAHTFAELSHTHNIEAPTIVCSYTSKNEFKLLKEYNTFKAMHQELYGNYHADKNETFHIFTNRLLGYTYDNGIVKDIYDAKDGW